MAVDPLLFTVRLFHILAGIAWVGGIVYNGAIVARKLLPAPAEVKGPAMGLIAPAGYKFLTWAGALTILFGVGNQMLINREVDPEPLWNMLIGSSLIVAIAMMGIGGAIVGPSIKKMAARPAPEEAARIQGRLKVASMLNMALGVIAVVMMVYATKLRVI